MIRAALLCLVLTACSCSQAVSLSHAATAADFVILRDSLPPEKGAVTICSWNNQPFVVVDYRTLGSVDDEALIVHEATHVRQARATKGGCWPYLYHYAHDSAFKAQTEFEAYCEEGRFLLTRNRDPRQVWAHIALVMWQRYGMKADNCIFEER